MRGEPSIRTGDIWYAVLDPIRGREQSGYHPVIVVSADWLHNVSGAELLFSAPLTTRDRQFATHVPIEPPEGGIGKPILDHVGAATRQSGSNSATYRQRGLGDR